MGNRRIKVRLDQDIVLNNGVTTIDARISTR